MAEEKNKPIKSFKAGGVEASIWKKEVEKDGKTIMRYSVRIQKQYRKKGDTPEKGDTYEITPYFFKSDLGDLVLVANKAYEFLYLRESRDDENIPI